MSSAPTPAPGSPVRYVRPELRALAPYTLEHTPHRFKLDQNEVPWDLPLRLKLEIAERLLARDWARYPDFHAEALRREVGAVQGWPAEGVLIGHGSGELLSVLLDAVVAPGSEVLGADPSFGLYPLMVLRAGGRYRPLPPRADLRLPFAELLAAVEREPRRPLLLCSPNNPTGDALTPEQVERLAGRLDALFVLDNAYGEFCRHDYRPLLARHSNLVLTRTFSKAWSLAGLRLGYLLAHPELVAELLKVKLPYNLGHGSAAAASVALAAPGVARRRVATLVGRRAQWAAMLAGHGFEVFPSEANFLLVRCPGGSRPVRDALAAAGILVREVGHYPGLAGCLRVSVGTGRALAAVSAVLSEMRSTSQGTDSPGADSQGIQP